MVKYRDAHLDQIFSALADPTRRAILTRLADGDASVGELSAPFEISAPAISKHLRVLERAGLLTQERDGRIRRCHLDADPLQEAAEWVTQYRRFWTQRLDQLDAYLQGLPPEKPAREKKSTRKKKG